jgi:hypothetical protein
MNSFRLKAEATGLAFALVGAACHTRPPASAPSPRHAQQNRPPSVRAHCEPCSVQIGKTVTVTATAADPDGDHVSYAWSAASGTITDSSHAETAWTAPVQEGPVPVSITVTDGKGGTASDVITIQVTKG